jgi:hypothetical protein
MEVSGGKKSSWIYLDICPVFFHLVPRLVQAVVITYYEIFQVLAVEGDILLPKPFLDLSFYAVVKWISPAWEIFFQFVKRVEFRGTQFRYTSAAHFVTAETVMDSIPDSAAREVKCEF